MNSGQNWTLKTVEVMEKAILYIEIIKETWKMIPSEKGEATRAAQNGSSTKQSDAILGSEAIRLQTASLTYPCV